MREIKFSIKFFIQTVNAELLIFDFVIFQEIFKELPAYKSFFTKVKSQGKYQGVTLPSAQIEHMNSRLNRVDILVPQQMNMLTFYKAKFELVIFLDHTEDKSLIWSKKFASIKNLEKLFNDYQVSCYYYCYSVFSLIFSFLESFIGSFPEAQDE